MSASTDKTVKVNLLTDVLVAGVGTKTNTVLTPAENPHELPEATAERLLSIGHAEKA